MKSLTTTLALAKIMVLALTLAMVGCGYNTPQYQMPTNFERTTIGHLEQISEPLYIPTALSIDVWRDFFVVVTVKDNKLVYIFDKQSGELLSSSVALGRAGNEIISPSSFQFDKNLGRITFYCRRSQKILDVDILESGETSITKRSYYNIPEQASYILDIDQDNRLIYANYPMIDSVMRFSLISHGKVVSTYNEEPLDDVAISTKAYSQSNLSISPDKSKAVIGTRNGFIMESFSLDSNTIELINRSYYIELADLNNIVYGVNDIVATDDRIYAIYSGDSGHYSFNKIGVFDWNHKPLELIEFESDNLVRMCVHDGDIYVVAINHEGEFTIAKVKR